LAINRVKPTRRHRHFAFAPSALGSKRAFKGFRLSAQEKSAIVKADRNPAVVPELDDLRYLTLQGLLGFPSEGFGDQPDPIANLETGVWLRFSVHLLFAFSPSATSRRMACARVIVLSADDAIQASIAASSEGCHRSPIWVPRPVVAGLPRFFLVVTRIDFAIIEVTIKASRGEVSPGSLSATLAVIVFGAGIALVVERRKLAL
jgi:hypothetical protein